MKVLASDAQQIEMTVNDGPVLRRGQDGAFEVPDALGKSMLRSSEYGRVGLTFRNVRQGFVCESCGRENLIRECGRCGAIKGA